MDRSEKVTFTNMCMICDGDRVLVQDRVDPKWPGITFPGGHVEKGESFTDAVIREVWEETGLRIASPRLCGIKDWHDGDSRYVVLLYKADRFSGELHFSDEGEVFWLELSKLPKQNLANDMVDMLRVFVEDELSEFYYFQENGSWDYVLK